MAVTASIALSAATVTVEQMSNATLTISNSGGSAVLVTGVTPSVVPNGLTSQSVSVALGTCPFGGAFPSSVAASGTLALNFSVTPHTPNSGYGNAEPAQQVYTIGALVATNDGSLTSASTANLTVNSPTH